MVDDYMLNEALDRIKEIRCTEEFDNTKTLVDTDEKLPGSITLKNAGILMTSVIKDDGKVYPQLFSEEALFLK